MLENAYMPPEGQSTVSYIKNKRIFFLSIFGHFPEDMSRSDNRRNLYRTWFGRDQFGYIYQQPGQITEVFITTQPHLKNQPTTRQISTSSGHGLSVRTLRLVLARPCSNTWPMKVLERSNTSCRLVLAQAF